MMTTDMERVLAGILGGSGEASMGKYKGMAPGCSLISLKVLDRFGNGNKEDILAAFRWIENHWEEYKDPDRKYFGRNNI